MDPAQWGWRPRGRPEQCKGKNQPTVGEAMQSLEFLQFGRRRFYNLKNFYPVFSTDGRKVAKCFKADRWYVSKMKTAQWL